MLETIPNRYAGRRYEVELSFPEYTSGHSVASAAAATVLTEILGVLAFTDVNLGILHAPSETGMDPVRATRLKNHKYRTTPLRALWQHPPYFHDGSAATLLDVVEHYDRVFALHLSPQQKGDLVEYLKSGPPRRAADDRQGRDRDDGDGRDREE